LIFFVLFYIDRLMRAFQPYMKNPLINNRPISTTGSVTPNLHASFWVMSMDSFTHIVLPTLTLLLISFAGYTRYTRASMLDVLNADYIRTARAKGLPERTVIMRHAFKNALIPLATVIPLDIASILGGAIITETIFGWRGLGVLFQRSLIYSDFNGVIGVLLVTASMTIAANIVADLLYVVLDPRIRLEQ
jgi:peptide/nickel transport system permease protein